MNELGHLYKKYKFSNFIKAMEFVNKIAEIAEQEAHHPDLTISWGEHVVWKYGLIQSTVLQKTTLYWL
ncbi:MAG: hypothetical protein IRF12RH_04525 [Rickettsia helvetica]|uniref:4a-hydroxytetrahydrobiopterin dehydratase n=1 Tax=Rickettsia helvetica TaxID=35789 RepID=A0ABP0T4N4_RICHE